MMCRQIFDQHRMRVARGRLKKGKGDTQNKVDAQSDQELQAAKEDFDNVSRFLSCRLISLEQERAQSLITQAARHHAAQVGTLASLMS
jgi:ABC-type phosphate transport system auxiliary subunit